jgi:hypothetical protein
VLGQYVDLGNPMAAHPLNDERVMWLYGLANPYTGGMYWQDLTGRGNHGLRVDGATWSEAPDGRHGLSLDGATGYVDVGADIPSLMVTTPFTAAGWFRTVNDWQQQIVSVYSQDPFPAGIILGVNVDGSSGGTLGLLSGDGVSNLKIIGSSGAVNDGAWHHAAAVWTGSDCELYLDGQLVTSSPYSVAPGYGAATYIRVGSHSENGNVVGLFSGSLADVSLWGRALSASEVFDLYAMSAAGYPPGGPLRYWSRKTWVLGGATASTTNRRRRVICGVSG